ncbi:MAG: AIR synthase related protein [Methanosphaera sp.]|nr:AIR synthase related protein [Methanosphaera sp.]
MDIEEYIKRSITSNKTEEETLQQLDKILSYYKDLDEESTHLLSKTFYDEVKTTTELDKSGLNGLLDDNLSGVHMGQFGVGSRGEGDFYVHSKIAEIIGNTYCESIVNPTAQDDGGVVKVDDTYYITSAIDGIHSRLSDYPFLAGFHTARATLRDVCVMGADPVALISDIHLADDGDVGKLLDYTAGICAVSELTGVPLVSGSTLRVGGDMVLGNRLVGAVGAIGSSDSQPTARANAHVDDIILMTEGSGGGTITTTSIYNNYPEVINQTMNVQFIKASGLLNDYEYPEVIHAMTDITNGGIRGDSREINKSTSLGIYLDEESITQLINPIVYSMLEELSIDLLGVSIDSLMIIVEPEHADNIIELLESNNIKCGVIGKVTSDDGVLIKKASGDIEELSPRFREAAYTPIKKVIDEINTTDYDDSVKRIDEATKIAIDKKDRIVESIRNRYE